MTTAAVPAAMSAHAATEQREQEGHGPTRDNGAREPAQHGAQHATPNDREQHNDGEQLPDVRITGGVFLRRRQGLAIDYADHALDAGSNAAIEISFLEARRNDLADDALAGGIG